MSDCEQYEEMISALLDRELSREDAALLRIHLNACEHCKQTFRELYAASEAVKSAAVSAPSALADRVMIQAEHREVETPPPGRPVRRRRSPLWIILPAAAVCVIVGIGAVKLLSSRPAAIQSQSAEYIEAAAEPETTDSTENKDTTVVYFDTADSSTDDAAEDAEAEAAPALDPTVTVTVSDEQSSAFEAIITPGSGPAASADELTVVGYAEYHGVVYEFLADSTQQNLYYMDAAEGIDPIYTAAGITQLYDALQLN